MLEHGGRRTLPGAAIFAVYVLVLLVTLLFFGSVSDYLGRLPVIITVLIFSVAGCVVFLAAPGTGALYVARSLQGVATGLASGPAGAALIDLQPAGSQRAPLVTSTFSNLGMAVGSRNLVWGGLVIFLLCGTGVVMALIFRGINPQTAMLAGCLLLLAAGQRAALVTAIFAVGYLAFSVPALIAGVSATKFGLHATALVYSASVAVLVVAATGVLLVRRSSVRGS